MNRSTLLAVIILLASSATTFAQTETIRLGGVDLEVRRYTIAKGEWNRPHQHRGMVLVITSGGEFFEEHLHDPGALHLRQDLVHVKNNSLGHRFGAIEKPIHIVEIELELPSQRLQPRTHNQSRVQVGKLVIVRRLTANSTCVDLSVLGSDEQQSVCLSGEGGNR